jgi:hypothetical protein
MTASDCPGDTPLNSVAFAAKRPLEVVAVGLIPMLIEQTESVVTLISRVILENGTDCADDAPIATVCVATAGSIGTCILPSID